VIVLPKKDSLHCCSFFVGGQAMIVVSRDTKFMLCIGNILNDTVLLQYYYWRGLVDCNSVCP